MSTPPQPPVTPGPPQPYTLSNLMPAPAPPAGRPWPPPPPLGWRPPPPRRVAPQPTRGPQWWRKSDQATRAVLIIAAVVAPLLIGMVILISATSRSGAPDTIRFDLVSCSYSGPTLPAVTSEFTATNSSNRDYRLTIKWEYRDTSGARIDTDTTRVTVPAGETIRDSETTLLPVAVSGGQCRYSLS
jgi:hypothetical protein